jgi:hypothetical protein
MTVSVPVRSQLKTKALAAQQQLAQQQQLTGSAQPKAAVAAKRSNGSLGNIFNENESQLMDEYADGYFSSVQDMFPQGSPKGTQQQPGAGPAKGLAGSGAGAASGSAATSAAGTRSGSGSGMERRDSDSSVVSAFSPGDNFDSLPEFVRDTCMRALVDRIKNVSGLLACRCADIFLSMCSMGLSVVVCVLDAVIRSASPGPRSVGWRRRWWWWWRVRRRGREFAGAGRDGGRAGGADERLGVSGAGLAGGRAGCAGGRRQESGARARQLPG